MSGTDTDLKARPWQPEPTMPVRAQIYEELRMRIIRGEILPGTALSEADLARRFAASRQPVREAFIKLVEDGLLEVRPQRGTFVRKISKNAVIDARFVREAIEAKIVRELARQHDQKLCLQLRVLLIAQKAVPINKPDSFMKLDEEFHWALANGAGRLYGWKVIEGLKVQMDRVRYLALENFPQETLIQQHAAITDAIERGLPDRAENEMQKHLHLVLDDLPNIERTYPDFFTPD